MVQQYRLFQLMIFSVVFSLALIFPTRSSDAGKSFDSDRQVLVESPAPAEDLKVLEGRIRRNSSIYDELVSGGVSPRDIFPLVASFEGIYDFRYARVNDRFEVLLTPKNRLRRFVYRTGPCDVYVAERDADGPFAARKKEVVLDRTVASRTFTIESSLYKAVRAGGENCGLVMAFSDIFSWDIDFYLYPRKGDRITVLFEKFTQGDTFIKYGDILFARYEGQNGTFSAVRSDDGGYYDMAGNPMRKMFLRLPIKFGVQTSSFSIRRFHPVKKKYRAHTGIDYGAPKGTPIFATADGVVSFSGWKNGYGKLVIIRHGNGYQTYYGHCNALVAKKGQTVSQGQTIARVGRTGVATGNHVHYEVRVGGKPVDPKGLKSEKGRALTGAKLDLFKGVAAMRIEQSQALLKGLPATVLAAAPEEGSALR